MLVAEGLLEKVVQACTAGWTQDGPSGTQDRPMQLAGIVASNLPIMNQLMPAAEGVARQFAAAAEGPEAAAAAAAVAEAAAAVEHAMRCSGEASVAQSAQAAALLPQPAQRLAAALLAWWRRPEAPPAAALELAQAAAARSCAYLRCANLGGEGGPGAGQGAGSQRCRWA